MKWTSIPSVGKFAAIAVMGWLAFSAMAERPISSTASSIWQPYSTEKLQASAAAGKPAVIDFSAEWCSGCRILESRVFTDPRIAGRLSQITALRVDATDMGAPQVQELIDQYGVFGLPTVVFLDSSGKEIKRARIEGVGPVEEFLESFELLARQSSITFSEAHEGGK